MHLITAAQLDTHPECVLNSIFFRVSQELAQTEAATVHRANALASLENINRTIIKRRLKGPGM